MRNLRYLFIVLLATATIAGAQDTTKKYGDIKFSGNLYSFYYYNMTNTQPANNSFPQETTEPAALGYNQFDIERMYFTAQSQLSANTAFRLTTDVYRNALFPASQSAAASYIVRDTSGKVQKITIPATPSSYFNGLSVRIKYGYFDWKPASDLTLRFGLQQTPWFDLVETAWGYRGVQQTAADKNKFIASADLGFSAGWAFPDKYGSLTAYIFNGQGYTAPEFDRFKDVAVKLEVNPFPGDESLKGLKIAAFDYMGSRLLTYAGQIANAGQSNNPLAYNSMGGMVWYHNDMWSLAVEYDIHTIGTGVAGTGVQAGQTLVSDSTASSTVLSIFGSIKGPGDMKDWALFARLDMFNPITSTLPANVTYTASNTKNTFIIAGVSCQVSKGLMLALDYQGTTFAHNVLNAFNATGTPATGESGTSASDARVFLHGIVTF
ncbi:MAG TPA: hypothetical protein VFJ29_00380 [Candidatus Kapabacteria bacterium]|nr:hypothetical protein [Candidatus Kapabacteria bacterium]